MILGIDTSAGQCAVGLLGPADHWVEREAMERGHAEALAPMIGRVLAAADLPAVSLTRIGVCTGPGSFTGIRVGVAFARGLALGLGVPVIGVTRFQAASVQKSGERLIPGRGGILFAQMFDEDGASAGPIVQRQGEAPEDLVDPLTIARLASLADPTERAAPTYVRPPDADPPSTTPPRILD